MKCAARTSRLLICASLCLLATAASGKGRGFSYTMSGVAYDQAARTPLANTALIIGRDTVVTDSNGYYTVSIGGVTCDRGGLGSIRRCNERTYGTLTVRRPGSDRSVTIRSRWKRYAFCDRNEYDCPDFTKDLYVP